MAESIERQGGWLAVCLFALLTKITGDKFLTSAKDHAVLGSTRASPNSNKARGVLPTARLLQDEHSGSSRSEEKRWLQFPTTQRERTDTLVKRQVLHNSGEKEMFTRTRQSGLSPSSLPIRGYAESI
jgi:hypothetical protein